MIYSQAAGYLLSGQTGSGAGVPADTRNAANYAYVTYMAGVSAVVKLQASHDSTGWMDVATYTAVATTGTAQLAGYFPFVRATVNTAYSNGTAYLHYAPGIK
jgi:hypothetical protein